MEKHLEYLVFFSIVCSIAIALMISYNEKDPVNDVLTTVLAGLGALAPVLYRY